MLETKLQQIEKRFQELSERLSHPETVANIAELQKIAKEHTELTEIIKTIQEYHRLRNQKGEAAVFLAGSDLEMKSLAQIEIGELDKKLLKIERDLKLLFVHKHPQSDRNAIVEIRAGTGGEEAALFVGDLLRMYGRFIEKIGWKMEVLDSNPTDIGGFKEVIFSVIAKGAYGKFRFESGIHRVQRVPRTEASGRIHTSAVTIAVLPEADEVDIQIKDSELRIDTFCSSSAGGQSVNTTYSAVRITHLPTGIVVQCQDERSQLKNKVKAMKVLYSRLKDRIDREINSKIAEDRRAQIGSGDRSQKIRTYNFPQNRISDHRIGLTLYKLDRMMEGDLTELFDALMLSGQEEYLENN